MKLEDYDMDFVHRVTAADGMIRGFFADTLNTAETARKNYNTTPVVTAAVGRLLTGTVMMGLMLKNDKDILTVSFKGDGPIKGLIATADSKGNVKGYAYEPHVILPLKKNGKLDVGGAVGEGHIYVVKDMGLKEPFSSTIPLISGEIAEDFTRYYAVSEQTPSVVSLGVLVARDLSVQRSGGFVVQLMPGIDDDIVTVLEKNLGTLDSITNMMESGMSPEDIMNTVLKGLSPHIHETIPVQFFCGCGEDKVKRAISLMERDEIDEILKTEGKISVNCHFCNTVYDFDDASVLKIEDEE